MSHFQFMVTKLTDKELLKQALRQQPEVVEVKENWYVRGYNKQLTPGDIVGVLNGNYDLGFVLKGDCYYAVADFSLGSCNNKDTQGLLALWQRIVATYNSLDSYKQASTQRGLEKANINVVIQ